MDGQPLTPAAIVFDNEAKAISLSAEVDANGIYQVKTHDAVGLPPGEYLVAVRPPMGGTQSIEALKKMADTSKIPQKYRSFKTSGLKRTVVEGTNTYDIDLQQAP